MDMITADEAASRIDASPFPKVTLAGIKDKIAEVENFFSGTLTIAVLTLGNGMKVVGQSACADPRNFDAEIGKRIAFDDAVRQIWALEGYLLRQRICEQNPK